MRAINLAILSELLPSLTDDELEELSESARFLLIRLIYPEIPESDAFEISQQAGEYLEMLQRKAPAVVAPPPSAIAEHQQTIGLSVGSKRYQMDVSVRAHEVKPVPAAVISIDEKGGEPR